MNPIDPQMLKGVLTPLLLALVADEDDYGYSLVERLREGGLTDVAEGTVYPALSRLERGGWLSTYHVPSERGPARKYYAITDDGRAELTARLDGWRHLVDLVTALTAGHLTKGSAS